MLLPFCYSWLAILVLTFGIICRIFGKVRTHKIKNCDRPFLNSRLSVYFVQTFSPNRASKTSPKNNKKPAKKPPNLFLNRVLKTISKKKRAPGKQFLGTLSESFLLDNEHFSDGQAQKHFISSCWQLQQQSHPHVSQGPRPSQNGQTPPP